MDRAITQDLLLARWGNILEVVRQKGGNPATDIWRDGIAIWARVLAYPRPTAGSSVASSTTRDLYVFKLDFTDYDDYGPRTRICEPQPPYTPATGLQYHPLFKENHPFTRTEFYCMPGDRRCQELGNHHEWAQKEHYHPDVIIASLWDTLNRPDYIRQNLP